MQRTISMLIAATGLLVLLVSACAPAAAPTAAPVVEQPTQAPQVEVQPTESAAVPETGSQPSAPVCQTTGASCAALDIPNADADDGYCVKKVRYHNILVPPGTTFEEIDSTGDFLCIDQGQMIDGKQVIACTGRQLTAYQLKLTNASCGANLATGTGQCAEGYGYDQTNQCCAPLETGGGSTTITVNIGACPGPQPTQPTP